ncbi:hypothetical protein [Streptomyces sp. NBC_01092]|uniref:hypothetical protein n=1 Tax=Streptomyces sp. NBC_01092 TaxID=2903748 RepID=UPI0038664FA1|nr:hypothetical protein OG254_21045 [Streptomyces sp. NBC_01092]
MSESAPDYALARLIDVVNGSSLELGITVTVSGSTITGTLISNTKWFDLQAESFKTAMKVEGDEIGLHSLFENWSRLTREAQEEEAKVREAIEGVELPDRYLRAIDEEDSSVAFIHLADARIVHPQGFVPAEGAAWRGRLDEVSGWFLGTLSQSSN